MQRNRQSVFRLTAVVAESTCPVSVGILHGASRGRSAALRWSLPAEVNLSVHLFTHSFTEPCCALKPGVQRGVGCPALCRPLSCRSLPRAARLYSLTCSRSRSADRGLSTFAKLTRVGLRPDGEGASWSPPCKRRGTEVLRGLRGPLRGLPHRACDSLLPDDWNPGSLVLESMLSAVAEGLLVQLSQHLTTPLSPLPGCPEGPLAGGSSPGGPNL